MNATTFTVGEKSGDYIKANVGPANRSEEPRFGLVDAVIVAFFLLCTGGLVSLLVIFR